MPNNKEDLLLRYRKTHRRVVDNVICPHDDVDVDATVAGVAAVATVATVAVITRFTFPSAAAPPSHSRLSPHYLSPSGQTPPKDPHAFALAAAAGDPSASHAGPVIITIIVASDTATAGTIVTGAIATAPVVTAGAVTPIARATTIDGLPNAPPHAPPIDWSEAPFDIGIHLDLNAPSMSLCEMDSDDDNESSSDDDSIFIDLS
jgi:hypothetical protein